MKIQIHNSTQKHGFPISHLLQRLHPDAFNLFLFFSLLPSLHPVDWCSFSRSKKGSSLFSWVRRWGTELLIRGGLSESRKEASCLNIPMVIISAPSHRHWDGLLFAFHIYSPLPMWSPKGWRASWNNDVLVVVYFSVHSVFSTFWWTVDYKTQDLAGIDPLKKWEGRKETGRKDPE